MNPSYLYIYNIFFCLFSFLVVLSALFVILSKNPVHAVLFLMLTFVNASCLFILQGCDFLGFLFIMVYVGAIAVLFLFVVMMLNLRMIEWHEYLHRYLPLGILLWVLLVVEVYWIYSMDLPEQGERQVFYASMLMKHFFPYLYYSVPEITLLSGHTPENVIVLVGMVLYTEYAIPFMISGFILLVAMLGAIVLTLQAKENVKRQSILLQTKRSWVSAVRYYSDR